MAGRAKATGVANTQAAQAADDIDFLPHHRRRLTLVIAGTASTSDGQAGLATRPVRSPEREADTEF